MAGRQGGFITRRQLLAEGLGRTLSESWIRTDRLIRVWPGVYAVGHVPTEPRARAHGAMLAAGDRSALGGWTAGALYDATKHWEPFELLSLQQRRVSGLKIGQSTTLLRRDIQLVDRLRVTSPARTSLDLAARCSEKRLHGIVDHLRLRHGLTIDQLTDIVGRNVRHRGATPLRVLIPSLSANPTRSGLERRWPRYADEYGLTPYEQNVQLGGHEVDVLIDRIVVVELDTWETHQLNFESDRRRDAEILARTGVPVVRVTDTQLDGDPAGTAAEILAVVNRRRAELRPAASGETGSPPRAPDGRPAP